jgi:hypothetical protein
MDFEEELCCLGNQKKGRNMSGKQPRSTKAVHTNPTEDVDGFMAQLNHPLKAEIEAVRSIILGVDERITESIKWNAPSFAVTEHFATFKLRPLETVQMVFHTGAKVKPVITPITIDDPAGLITWAAPDRCVATFSDMQDIQSKDAALVAVVQQWIAQM